jgi:hypothetical protein
MRTWNNLHLVPFAGALALALAAGCGDGTSAGGGTRTLTVNASVSATESVDNAQTAGQFSTDFRVTVSKNGTPVEGATVTIGSTAGVATLTPATPAGTYTGRQTGYYRTYTLNVTAGADNVEGASVAGPDEHHFTVPTPGMLHKMGTPLEARWEPSGAPEAVIETKRMNEAAIPDTGMFSIAPGSLESEAGKLKEEEVRVRRTNRTLLSGGAAGSQMEVRVRNLVKFQVDGR